MDRFSKQFIANYNYTSMQRHKAAKAKYGNKRKAQRNKGYIYLILCKGTNYYKVGYTKSKPYSRLGELQVGCPYELILKIYFEKENPIKVESAFHKRFKDYLIRGEWFNLDENIYTAAKKFLLIFG